jgi:L-alanine-DL-glutamate epimerase-like enolase superfamily enzyme
MKTQRRDFLKGTAALAAISSLPSGVVGVAAAPGTKSYPYLGRTDDYSEFRVIDSGLTSTKVESWTQGSYGIVRVTTQDGREGWGQLSSSEPDLTAAVLHRQVARHVLRSDPAQIDALVDRVIDANMRFPWSYVCRALAGVDTAIWDLYGRIKGQPVCALLGGKTDPFPVYGSSMRRDISPEDEAARLVKLRDEHGYQAFKVRLGTPTGHDRDAAPGRTEQLISAVRQAVGGDVRLLADGNSCDTPPRAIEVGRRLEDHGYYWFEEPCP